MKYLVSVYTRLLRNININNILYLLRVYILKDKHLNEIQKCLVLAFNGFTLGEVG